MDDKSFSKLISQVDYLACSVRGHTLSEEQYKQISDSWQAFKNCYEPCRPPSEPNARRMTIRKND